MAGLSSLFRKSRLSVQHLYKVTFYFLFFWIGQIYSNGTNMFIQQMRLHQLYALLRK
jgi:hypothetical protein